MILVLISSLRSGLTIVHTSGKTISQICLHLALTQFQEPVAVDDVNAFELQWEAPISQIGAQFGHERIDPQELAQAEPVDVHHLDHATDLRRLIQRGQFKRSDCGRERVAGAPLRDVPLAGAHYEEAFAVQPAMRQNPTQL